MGMRPALALLAAAVGCGQPASLRLVNTPAQGRPETCPDDAIDPFGDGTPSPMQRRCSFEDAAGKGVTRLGGTVLAEGEPGSPGTGVPQMSITVHRVEPPARLGDRVGHATTDAQGHFHLGANLAPGQYVIVVRGTKDGEPLAQRQITLEGNSARRVEDVVVWLPKDSRLGR